MTHFIVAPGLKLSLGALLERAVEGDLLHGARRPSPGAPAAPPPMGRNDMGALKPWTGETSK